MADDRVQSGAEMIANERARQMLQEGWTPEHDDEHDKGELVWAARAYAQVYMLGKLGNSTALASGWPWDRESFKVSDDPIRNLVKAGALIAAEIDRLRRKDR